MCEFFPCFLFYSSLPSLFPPFLPPTFLPSLPPPFSLHLSRCVVTGNSASEIQLWASDEDDESTGNFHAYYNKEEGCLGNIQIMRLCDTVGHAHVMPWRPHGTLDIM
jgi:hypothetical protein